MERKGHMKGVMVFAISLLLLVQLGLAWAASVQTSVITLGVLLFAFFLAFNALEASQPSLASKLAEPAQRGSALGVFNTAQSLGVFAGGAVGGVLLQSGGAGWLYGVWAGVLAVWLVVVRGLDLSLARH